MPEDDDLIDAATAVQILDVSRATLTRWVQAGRLAIALELKGSHLFRRADVERVARERVA